jgi:hypothetical protein
VIVQKAGEKRAICAFSRAGSLRPAYSPPSLEVSGHLIFGLRALR